MGIGAAIVGGSLGSALIGSSASRSASRAQTRANDAAIAEQRRQFNEIMRLTAPQRAVGNQAMNAIAQLLGLPGAPPTESRTPSNIVPHGNAVQRLLMGMPGLTPLVGDSPTDPNDIGDFNAADALTNIPGNEVIVDDMMRRIRQSSPTTGGNVLTALADRVGGFQSDRLFSSLFQLAGFGPSGTSAAVAGAGNTGNAVSNLLQSSGIANASGIMGQGQALNAGLQNVLQFFTLQSLLGGGGGGSAIRGID